MDFPLVNFRGDDAVCRSTVQPGGHRNSMNEELGSSITLDRYASNLEEHEILTSTGIPQRVYVQPSKGKMAMITYHDIGTNHTSFLSFFNYPEMRVLTKNFTIYHICAPGHHENASNELFSGVSGVGGESLIKNGNDEKNPVNGDRASIDVSATDSLERPAYPSMDELARMLTSIVVHFGIECFIGFGVGAGSNILARYALHNADNVLGMFLINPTATTHTYYQRMRCSWWDLPYLQQGFLTENLLNQLDAHWFGYGLAENQDVVHFYHQLARSLNPINVAGYIRSFMDRTALNLIRPIGPSYNEPEPVEPTVIKADVCLITGDRAVDLSRTLADMNGLMDPKRTQFIAIPDCTGMVMEEEPDKLSVDLLHFLRSIGLLVNLTPERMHKQALELQRNCLTLGASDNAFARLNVEMEVVGPQPV